MNNTVTILRQYSDNLFFGIADNTDHEIQYHKYSDNIFINTEQYENIYCHTYCQPYCHSIAICIVNNTATICNNTRHPYCHSYCHFVKSDNTVQYDDNTEQYDFVS